GAWKLVREIGRGGMGSVWLAERAGSDFAQRAAIKLLRADLAGAEVRARFAQERKVLARLSHPNIAHLLDGGIGSDDRPWLAMEYVEGTTLRALLAKRALPLKRVISLATQIAEALAHAHAAGVVHRDLKPENVLVTHDGRAKLLDFGIAKLIEGPDQLTGEHHTEVGRIIGTAAYMSPEQAAGQPLDFRSDQFSFGALLYEMVTSRAAFARATPSATLAAILRDEPEPVLASSDVQPPGLARLLKRCLAKDPVERYASTLDLARDVRELGVADPAAIRTNSKRPGAAHVAAIAVSVALLVAAAWWIGRGSRPLLAPSEIIRSHISIAPAHTLAFGFYTKRGFALSPDGSVLVFCGQREGEKRRLFRRPLAQLEATAIDGTEGAAGPVFSPDGAWLAFFANQKLKKIALAGGSATVLSDAPYPMSGLAWLASNEIVFSPLPTAGLFRVSADGGEAKVMTKLDGAAGEVGHGWPEVTSDGRVLLFAAEMDPAENFDGANLVAMDLATGRHKLLLANASDPHILPDGRLAYAHGGTVYVVDFDAEKMAVSGAPLALLEGVTYSPASGAAQFATARTGTTVYLPGSNVDAKRIPVWVDRAGREQPLALPARKYEVLRIAPDGRKAVVQVSGADDDLWLFEFGRGAMTRLTSKGENIWPVWSPDSRRIAFSYEQEGHANLHVLAAEGNAPAERLVTSDTYQFPTSWSVDGRTIAFNQEAGSAGSDIWLFDLDTRKSRPFLVTPAKEQGAQFSPDDRWIAYVSDDSGVDEVYVQASDGNPRRWQASVGGGQSPVWSADGRELLYATGGSVHSVAIAAGDDPSPAAPVKLFEGRYLPQVELAPDGSRMLMLRIAPNQDAAGPLVLLQGLLESGAAADKSAK
ncbi:MAG: protein kinase, partial [Lysobacterales bacterium]